MRHSQGKSACTTGQGVILFAPMIILPILLIITQAQGPAPAPATRTFTVDDVFRLQRVSDPRVSPDGKWVAYVVSTPDLAADKSTSRIWMVGVAGGDPIPLTTKGSSASSPRWSPDGKYLGFLATRGEDAETQVWLLNRLGGEAEQLTSVKQGVGSFVWSPDGGRLAIEIEDQTPEQAGDTTWIGAKAKTQRPYGIDRLQFKRDGTGSLGHRRTHLYVFDVRTKAAARQITSGDWDDEGPAWSPDGHVIAFTSNRDSVDGNDNSDVWVVASDDSDVRVVVAVDRKSTRLNSSHLGISYAVFCLKKKNNLFPVVAFNPRPPRRVEGFF